jgi:outer membrane beta-barrel protein
MKSIVLVALATAVAAIVPEVSPAQQTGQRATEQVVVPDVARREIKLPRFPSKDFAFGVFAGTYSAQNFGASAVYGVRLGYHLTEDFFAEAALARTRITDEDFRLILPGGIFPQPNETLTYYNLSIGYNVMPGEVFFGRNVAKASAVYVIGGIGSTRVLEQRRQTLNFGLGMRVLPWDRFAVQVDLRDHIYSLDLLGRRESKQNIELTAGVTYYFF